MKDVREKLAETLQADATLVSMLAENESWVHGDDSVSKVNSIIPSDKAPLANTPYITIHALTDTQVGTNLVDAFYVVRCYNSSDKSFVEIDDILSRVKALLHRHRFNYGAGKASIDTYYETTGAELQDQAFKQNFRGSQYRVLYL